MTAEPAAAVAPGTALHLVIGRNVTRLREAAGLTRADLAKRAGSSWQTVQAIELGWRAPSVEMISRLAAALGTSPDVLLIDPDAAPCGVCHRQPPPGFTCKACGRG